MTVSEWMGERNEDKWLRWMKQLLFKPHRVGWDMWGTPRCLLPTACVPHFHKGLCHSDMTSVSQSSLRIRDSNILFLSFSLPLCLRCWPQVWRELFISFHKENRPGDCMRRVVHSMTKGWNADESMFRVSIRSGCLCLQADHLVLVLMGPFECWSHLLAQVQPGDGHKVDWMCGSLLYTCLVVVYTVKRCSTLRQNSSASARKKDTAVVASRSRRDEEEMQRERTACVQEQLQSSPKPSALSHTSRVKLVSLFTSAHSHHLTLFVSCHFIIKLFPLITNTQFTLYYLQFTFHLLFIAFATAVLAWSFCRTRQRTKYHYLCKKKNHFYLAVCICMCVHWFHRETHRPQHLHFLGRLLPSTTFSSKFYAKCKFLLLLTLPSWERILLRFVLHQHRYEQWPSSPPFLIIILPIFDCSCRLADHLSRVCWVLKHAYPV